MQVIPSIDLRGGQVVRLAQGDFARETRYSADPLEVARGFAADGAPRIHVVDLDGARSGEPAHADLVKALVAAVAPVEIQLGGGIRSLAAATAWFGAGVRQIVLGTLALTQPEILIAVAERHPDRVILGLDTRAGHVATHGWESSADPAEAVLRRFEGLPLGGVLHTCIERDGLAAGPDVEGTAALARLTRHRVIASGGVGSLEHIRALAREPRIAAAIVGRALYSGAVSLREALRAGERPGC